jgi:hypothetical protein
MGSCHHIREKTAQDKGEIVNKYTNPTRMGTEINIFDQCEFENKGKNWEDRHVTSIAMKFNKSIAHI